MNKINEFNDELIKGDSINAGFKDTKGKLPLYTVFFKQFPHAFSLIDKGLLGWYRVDISFDLLDTIHSLREESINKIFNRLFHIISEGRGINGLNKIAQCSVLGHEKYKKYDEDWQNFSRVENAYEHYLNAGTRHLFEGDCINKEDSTEDIIVNHLDQAAWNFLAAIEIRERNKKEDNDIKICTKK